MSQSLQTKEYVVLFQDQGGLLVFMAESYATRTVLIDDLDQLEPCFAMDEEQAHRLARNARKLIPAAKIEVFMRRSLTASELARRHDQCRTQSLANVSASRRGKELDYGKRPSHRSDAKKMFVDSRSAFVERLPQKGTKGK
jgi:hypothetical protein